MKKNLVLTLSLFITLWLCSCKSASIVDYKQPSEGVEIFLSIEKPTQSYQPYKLITSTVFYWATIWNPKKHLIKHLRKMAKKVGADAVVDVKFTPVTFMFIFYGYAVEGVAVKYTNSSNATTNK